MRAATAFPKPEKTFEGCCAPPTTTAFIDVLLRLEELRNQLLSICQTLSMCFAHLHKTVCQSNQAVWVNCGWLHLGTVAD